MLRKTIEHWLTHLECRDNMKINPHLKYKKRGIGLFKRCLSISLFFLIDKKVFTFTCAIEM